MGHSIKNNFARVGSIKNFFFKFMCLWLLWVFTAVLGLSLAAVSGGLLFIVVHSLLIAVAPLVAEHGLQGSGLQ